MINNKKKLENKGKGKKNNEYDELYDFIIDINSIEKLNDGWVIHYNGDEKKTEKTRNVIKSKEQTIISILGHSNRGKTYILGRISSVQLNPGYDKTTKGISGKIFAEHAIFLDTVGTNAPLLIEDIKNDPRDKDHFNSDIVEKFNLFQIITNYIIQTYVIQYADILLCVIGMLTTSEQRFLNKIKKICAGKKKLIVIHNLIHLFNKKQIEEYINIYLKRSITYDLREIIIPNVNNNKNKDYFNKYYIEINKDEEQDFEVLHFIMANDTEKDGKNEGRFFNSPTIDFIRNKINQTINKGIDIHEKLIEHIKNISNQVLENNIENVEISVISNSQSLIKCNGQIKPKKITADVLDNIFFISNDYEPPYRYYRNENIFTIEIQICAPIKDEKIIIDYDYIEESEELYFNITGERDLEENEEKNIFYEIYNKRTWKTFKVEFKINMKDYNIESLDLIENKEINYGILFINFNIK